MKWDRFFTFEIFFQMFDLIQGKEQVNKLWLFFCIFICPQPHLKYLIFKVILNVYFSFLFFFFFFFFFAFMYDCKLVFFAIKHNLTLHFVNLCFCSIWNILHVLGKRNKLPKKIKYIRISTCPMTVWTI